MILHLHTKSVNARLSYDVISIFQDGGHRVGNLLTASVLVMTFVYECLNLSAHLISMRYLNPQLSYYYFRFVKTDIRHIGILLVSVLTYSPSWAWHLHWRAKFHLNWSTQSWVMMSYRFFKMVAIELEIYFQLRFLWWHSFRNVQIYHTPHFDEISQSTAQLLLLMVCGNGRPPYWNSISGFVFVLFVVIGMASCKFRPNQSTHSGVVTSCRFFKMAVGRYVGFRVGNIGPPTKCNVGPSLVYKFGVGRIYSFGDIAILRFGV